MADGNGRFESSRESRKILVPLIFGQLQIHSLAKDRSQRQQPLHETCKDGATNHREEAARYVDISNSCYLFLTILAELQQQYTNYKNGLQQIASKIGDVESEAEEHKFVPHFCS